MVTGGHRSSSGSERPLTGEERANIFDWGAKSIGDTRNGTSWGGFLRGQMPEYRAPAYQRPGFTDPGGPQSLSGGDYDRLEGSLLQSRWAPIEALQGKRFDAIDQEMSDRGLYTSGVGADKKQEIFSQDFLPAFQQAAGEATAQRYGLEAGENQAANNYDLARSGMANQSGLSSAEMENQVSMENAQRRQASQWAPFEYLMGLYNQTGGSIGSRSSSGWDFGLGN